MKEFKKIAADFLEKMKPGTWCVVQYDESQTTKAAATNMIRRAAEKEEKKRRKRGHWHWFSYKDKRLECVLGDTFATPKAKKAVEVKPLVIVLSGK